MLAAVKRGAAVGRGLRPAGRHPNLAAAAAAPPPPLLPRHLRRASSTRRSLDDPVVPEKIVEHAYTTKNMKWMPGFSFPAPRNLEQIIKYALLEREPPAEIKRIWNAFHDPRLDCVATTWSRAEYEGIKERKRRCPRFVYPVLKGDGKFFSLVAEWQDRFCIFTYLDDYRKNPSRAEPYMSVALYDDFLARKDLVLVRGDFTGHLKKADAIHIMNLMRYFYFTEPKAVEDFNLTPGSFNFEAFLQNVPRPGTLREAKIDRDGDDPGAA